MQHTPAAAGRMGNSSAVDVVSVEVFSQLSLWCMSMCMSNQPGVFKDLLEGILPLLWVRWSVKLHLTVCECVCFDSWLWKSLKAHQISSSSRLKTLTRTRGDWESVSGCSLYLKCFRLKDHIPNNLSFHCMSNSSKQAELITPHRTLH